MKTRLDIHKSASTFAHELLDNLSLAELDKRIHTRSESEKISPEDYPQWKQDVLVQRDRYLQFKNQPSPSEKAKKIAAAPKK